MSTSVALRVIEAADLPVLCEHQLDPEATRLAAFPSRPRDAFLAHWAKVLANPANATRAIVLDGRVVGHIGAWTDAETGARQVGYWIGREFWGRGIATAALGQFLHYETTRPLTAGVVRHNAGSIRVLQKCGFVEVGEAHDAGAVAALAEELVFRLG